MLNLWATCHEKLFAYVDGTLQDDQNFDNVYKPLELDIPADSGVLALKCYSSGPVKGILASMSNGKATNTHTWKCSDQSEDGWTLDSFNDDHWAAPVSFG